MFFFDVSYILPTILVLCVAQIGLLQWGRRMGRNDRQTNIDLRSFGTLDNAVFALMGLLVAFTFAGSAERFEERQKLAIEESNAIATAYSRVDVLPKGEHAAIRELFRRYVDSRIETFRSIKNMDVVNAELKEQAEIYHQIWTRSTEAMDKMDKTEKSLAGVLILPALNAMSDVASTRAHVTRIHTPWLIYILLIALGLICSLLGGYSSADSHHSHRDWLHTLLFAGIISMTIFVIIDLEFPRAGFLRVDHMNVLLEDVRSNMN